MRTLYLSNNHRAVDTWTEDYSAELGEVLFVADTEEEIEAWADAHLEVDNYMRVTKIF